MYAHFYCKYWAGTYSCTNVSQESQHQAPFLGVFKAVHCRALYQREEPSPWLKLPMLAHFGSMDKNSVILML